MTAYRAAKPWLDDGDLTLYHGDVLHVLEGLPDGIAQTCVTSPPYWGLRDYGTGSWSGGDPDCDHSAAKIKTRYDRSLASSPIQDGSRTGTDGGQYARACPCGARRVDDQLGLEATPDLYVAKMVAVFREVRRILRDDGTLWLNIGDSYTANGGGGESRMIDLGKPSPNAVHSARGNGQTSGLTGSKRTGLKPKDLVGIPWRLAFALQQDGWYLRSDIIWSKPNPMPESVTDRPTKAHEYVFLFSKQPRYFYDADAVREPHTPGSLARHSGPLERPYAEHRPIGTVPPGHPTENHLDKHHNGLTRNGGIDSSAGRNLRSVWQIATQPFPEAHFATYPEELVRRCILAGTSERGGCAECGAPWRRVTETSLAPTNGRTSAPNKGRIGAWQEKAANMTRDGFVPNRDKHVETTGWEPSCSCEVDKARDLTGLRNPPDTRPQLVLDPFVGSGTTALVARKHGRRSIGIDLSAKYLAIAARRTQQLSLLGAAR